MSSPIEVEAIILRYIPNAMVDHFDSGGFAAYDCAELQITAPERLRDKKLKIYHDKAKAVDDLWQHIQAKVRFTVSEDDLAYGDLLYAPALSNVEEVAPHTS